MIQLPTTFKPSKRAPSIDELDWLYQWLKQDSEKTNISTVLEFGCGITSWIIQEATHPKTHIAMEAYQPCIDITKSHCPNIEFVTTTWSDIPKIEYQLIFVDASTNPPKDLKPLNGKYCFRNDAIKYIGDCLSEDGIIIIHDWCYGRGWEVTREYLEANNYSLIDSYTSKHGIGVYTK